MAWWISMVAIGFTVLASVLTIIATTRQIEAPPARKCVYTSPPNETCSICLFDMSNDDIRYLYCGHALHDHCFEELKKRCNECPICRHPISI